MLRKPGERIRTIEPTSAANPHPRTGLGCRAVQVGLAIYLSPIILVVLLIGGTAVVSNNFARLAGRIIPGKSIRAGSGLILKGMKPSKDDRVPLLTARSGRGRTP